MKKTLKLLLVASMMFTFLVTGATAQSENSNVPNKMIIEPDYDKI